MKRCHLYLLLGMLIMLPMVTLHAQTLPCTPNEVTAGFAQAAQSGALETWAAGYGQSTCPANIKNGASAMAAAYFAMSATMIPFISPSDPSVLNPVFGWQPGGAVGNSYDLTLYPGELSLIADAGTYPSSFPMLIYPFQGNFQVAVRLDFQTDGPRYHGAGIGFRAAQDQSIGDWIVLMSHFGSGGLEIRSDFLETQNLSHVNYANSIVYLRITKHGTLFSAEYSTDGANWVTLVSNSVISLPSDVEIFLYTYSTNGEGVIARFSEFSIVAR